MSNSVPNSRLRVSLQSFWSQLGRCRQSLAPRGAHKSGGQTHHTTKKDKKKTPQRPQTFSSTEDATGAETQRQPVTQSTASPRWPAAAVALAGGWGAGVQQNISKRVWAQFRSVRQSLRPMLQEDPLFRRVSAGLLSSAPLMSSFVGAGGQICSMCAQPSDLVL